MGVPEARLREEERQRREEERQRREEEEDIRRVEEAKRAEERREAQQREELRRRAELAEERRKLEEERKEFEELRKQTQEEIERKRKEEERHREEEEYYQAQLQDLHRKNLEQDTRLKEERSYRDRIENLKGHASTVERDVFVGGLAPIVDVSQLDLRDQYFTTKELPLAHPKVVELQQQLESSGSKFSVIKAEFVYNKLASQRFSSQLKIIEGKRGREEYVLTSEDLEKYGEARQRSEILQKLLSDHSPLLVRHGHRTPVACLYHGTSYDHAKKIIEVGFAEVNRKNDAGWFGKGLYMTDNPAWAAEYCENRTKPCLISSFLILENPFPVISCDAPPKADPTSFTFYGAMLPGKVNVIPVRKYGDMDARPPCGGEQHEAIEFVTNYESHTLAQIIFHLSGAEPVVTFPPDLKSWTPEITTHWIRTVKFTSLDIEALTKLIIEKDIDAYLITTMAEAEFAEVLGITTGGEKRRLSVAARDNLTNQRVPLQHPLELLATLLKEFSDSNICNLWV
jgi:hypothetical protein